MKPLYATQHEAALIASLPEGGTGMLCREVKIPAGYSIGTPEDWNEAKMHPAMPNFNPSSGVVIVPDDPLRSVAALMTPFPLGAVLAVKEGWCQEARDGHGGWSGGYLYRATEHRLVTDISDISRSPWSSGARMPAHAVRSYIRITSLRVARVHDVTKAEARSMGYKGFHGACGQTMPGPPQNALEALIRHIEGEDGNNPYVWLPTFEKVPKP